MAAYANVAERIEVEGEYRWRWHDRRDSIKRVSVIGPASSADMSEWFEGCENLESVNLNGFLVGDISSMSWLFKGCRSLKSVDFSGMQFNEQSPNVYSVSHMYDTCWELSQFTFDKDTMLVAHVLPYNGTWTSPDGRTTYDTADELAAAFNADPAGNAGTWTYEEDKDLADASVTQNSGTVAYVEGGLPLLSNTVRSVSYHGKTLTRGVDYELQVVDKEGTVVTSVPVSDGEYFVRVVGIGEFAGTVASERVSLRVIDEYDISTFRSYTITETSRYTGKSYTSSYYLYNPLDSSVRLTAGVDYTVSYETADGAKVTPVEPGTYNIMLTGIGVYRGVCKYGTLRIAEKNDLAYASVNTNMSVHWIGKVVNAVLVSACGTPLTPGVDYKITYLDADGNELDSMNAPGVYTFVIEPSDSGDYTNKYSSKDHWPYREITVFEGDEVSRTKGNNPADLYYNATVYLDDEALSRYSSDLARLDYGQGVALPAAKVTMNGEELVEGVDYVSEGWKNADGDAVTSLEYLTGRPTHASRYSYTITAVEGGKYTGSASRYVQLYNGHDLSLAQLAIASDFSARDAPVFDYTGAPVDLSATLSIGDTTVPASSYELLYAKCEGDVMNKGAVQGSFTGAAPTERGLYCVYAQPVGSDYTGMFRGNRYSLSSTTVSPVYFQIGGRNDLSLASVYSRSEYNYTGAAVRPNLNVYYPTGESWQTRPLTAGVDYEISGYRDADGNLLSEAVDEGSYTAVIKGIGSMTGEAECSFKIREYGNFSEAKFDYNGSVNYTGEKVYPDLTVTIGDEELVQGVDYVIESVEPAEYGSTVYSTEPIAMGSYVMTLRGVSARGVAGTRTISYTIVDGRSLSGASVEGLAYEYPYTGEPVNPKPSAVKANGKNLTEGTDYVVEYRRSYTDENGDSVTEIVDSCTEVGSYDVRIVGYGDYAYYASRSFRIYDPAYDYSGAKFYLVKDGARELLKNYYDYTGANILDGTLEIEVGGKVLDPGDYVLSMYDGGGEVTEAIEPGTYTVGVRPDVDTSLQYRSGYLTFRIGQKVIEEKGVQAQGSVFADKADAEAGTEVVMSVETKGKDEVSTATAREVVKGCEKADAAYVGVVDVTLDVVKSATGEEVEALTEGFGDLELSFPVGEQFNGTAARVVQIHTDAKTGVVSALRHPVTRVTDGRVSVTVDCLSEFVIMVGANAESLEFERPAEVAKPTATDFVHDGSAHVGVQPSKGYVLSGVSEATEVGEYTATATLAEGYQWSDGTSGAVTLTWKIVASAIDLSKATVALEQSSYVYDGEAKKPGVAVTLDGKELVAGVDYTVGYTGNVEVGEATVTVTGKGAYTGVAFAAFQIVAASQDESEPDPAPDPTPAPAKSDLATYAGAAARAEFGDLDPAAWYTGGDGTRNGYFPGTDTLYLDYTVARGLMSGYASGGFGPADRITRGQAALILYRLATGDMVNGGAETRFSDVGAGDYFGKAVAWAADKGVVTGYTGTDLFGPDDPVTREQLATMIFRYVANVEGARGAGPSPDRLGGFSDRAAIHGWAEEGVAWCLERGVMSGYGDGSAFGPGDNAERCQMAKIVAVTARMLE